MKNGSTPVRARDTADDALRRWLRGQDGALEEWLGGRVRKVRHRTRTLSTG